jgi:cytochrome b pre-mRNA-processing protein 3
MFSWLKPKPPQAVLAEAHYAAIVDQARRPEFYVNLGVPDTIEGRFEVIALHMALLIDRLSNDGPAGQDVARTVNEVFVTDMDDNMREIGVGDLAVPRKVKKAAAAVYDRAGSLRAALKEPGDAALQAILAVNVHGHGSTTQQSAATDQDLEAFARYVRAASTALKVQTVTEAPVFFPTVAAGVA